MTSSMDDDITKSPLNLKRTPWKYDDGSPSRELVTYNHGDHSTGALDVQKLGPYKVNFSHSHVYDFRDQATRVARCHRDDFRGTIEGDGGLKVDLSPPLIIGKRYFYGLEGNSSFVVKFAEGVEKVMIVHSYENQGEGLVVKVFVESLGEKGITFRVEECKKYWVATSNFAYASGTEKNTGGGGGGYQTEVWSYSNSGQQYTRGLLNSSAPVQGNNNNHVVIYNNPPRQFITLAEFVSLSIYKGIKKLTG